MDRSFLSREDVAVASRDFVCIRLATYEDQEEANFLSKIYIGRSGDIENTTFGILAPNGRDQLVRPGRGPHHAFRSSRDMAEGMKTIAGRYPDRKAASSGAPLPLMESVDIGLNVASCDGLPLIVTVAKSAKDLEATNSALAKLAWENTLAGQFIYATTTEPKQLNSIALRKGFTSGIAIVSPDDFGLMGKVLAEFPADVDPATLKKKMAEIAANYPRSAKSRSQHIQLGIQLGVDWKTEIPETDQQALRAKERIRNGR